jgi:signal-transduction protein with cAMP-binding, CBS, and nucleotidyltransferase domain
MLLMANTHIRHLPIIKNKQVVGMVTAADLLRKQSHNVVHMLSNIDIHIYISRRVIQNIKYY